MNQIIRMTFQTRHVYTFPVRGYEGQPGTVQSGRELSEAMRALEATGNVVPDSIRFELVDGDA